MLSFESKDPVLAKHYEDLFKEDFEKQAALMPQMTTPEQMSLFASFRLAMYREAARQEHYDYTVDDEGKRQLMLDPTSGNPKLMIPKLTYVQKFAGPDAHPGEDSGLFPVQYDLGDGKEG